MPPFQLSQPAPADPRFLEPRQVDELLSFDSKAIEARRVPESVAATPEDFTLKLLGSKRAARQGPIDLVARSSDDGNTLVSRQQQIRLIPSVYQIDGPAPGTVVGITLGAIAGFLLLIYLLWLVSNGTSTVIRTTGNIEEIDVVRRRSRSPRTRRTRSRRQEMSSRGGSPRRVVRTERIIRDFGDRSPSPSVIRDRSRVRETIIVPEPRSERRFSGDDVIEVIEEHSGASPRRDRRRRDSGSYRSVYEERVRERLVENDGDDEEDWTPSGYRTIDPRQPGGGTFKSHRVR